MPVRFISYCSLHAGLVAVAIVVWYKTNYFFFLSSRPLGGIRGLLRAHRQPGHVGRTFHGSKTREGTYIDSSKKMTNLNYYF